MDAKVAPRHLLLLHEYVDLQEVRSEAWRARFADLKRLTRAQKQARFGSPFAPIYVPLAPGESKEQYEERFVWWLKVEERMTLKQVQAHSLRVLERQLRMKFAALNARGIERFVPPRATKRPQDGESEDPPRKMAKWDCLGRDSAEGRQKCACRQCLLVGIRVLAQQIAAVEAKAAELKDMRADGSGTSVMDLTTETTADQSSKDEDRVDQQLLSQYNSINEQIVMNERVLDASAARLARDPIVDVQRAAQLQDEDQEMRELIEEEAARRDAALAIPVVWMWRHHVEDLRALVEHKHATDVPFVQRACHSRCADIELEIESTLATRSQLTAELCRLREQRRTAFLTLVRFNGRLRSLIRGLLSQI